MFTNALQQGEKIPLSSLYGALQGLSELGSEVTRIFILPRIRNIGELLCNLCVAPKTENSSNFLKCVFAVKLSAI